MDPSPSLPNIEPVVSNDNDTEDILEFVAPTPPGDSQQNPLEGNISHSQSQSSPLGTFPFDTVTFPDTPEDPVPKRNEKVIGPQLPSFLLTRRNEESILPSVTTSSRIIGPELPFCLPTSSHNSQQNELILDEDSNISVPEEPQSSQISGTNFPAHVTQNYFLPSNSDDEDIIGPKPPPMYSSVEEERSDYINRILDYKMRKEDSSGLKREEWMLQPPKKNLKPYTQNVTSFSRASGQANDNGKGTDLWTTLSNGTQPQSSSKSADLSSVLEDARRAEHDEQEGQRAAALNKERGESLLQIHQRKRKIEPSTASSNTNARRPFNRDSDLQIPRGASMNSDEAKEMLGSLQGRFGQGSSTRKFL